MTDAVDRVSARLPARSEIAIIGGGVIGCAVAWQLAQRGKTDVLVLERKRLTEGSTWHAAGLVGQLRSTPSLSALMRASVAVYADLEQQTGYATGWHGVGSVRIAASEGRWAELQRHVQVASTVGLDAHLVSAAEALELVPLLSTDGVHGAAWVPSDGYADPSQLTHSFATGARAAGVRFAETCTVQAAERTGRRLTALITTGGRIECDTVVNATGMWGRRTAALAGASLAVGALEHQYVVTEQIDGLPEGLPTLRDPDARMYLKPETGALLIGGWEDGTRMPWPTPPDDFGPQLFLPSHARFAPLGEAAAQRIPAFAAAGIRTWVNGPIPFTPDAEPVIGLDPGLENLVHCCGFPAGIAAAGGAGQCVANWIVDGEPGLDLKPFAVTRFGDVGDFTDGERRLAAAYAGYYKLGEAAPLTS